MAVKKSTAPKAGAAKTAKAPKAAAKKAAPKAKAPKAAAKKAAPKKAAIKLTDNQKQLLMEVASKGDAGLPSDKSNLKGLTALQGKKLVKKGKKGPDGSIPYHLTKLGAKHAAPPASPESSSSSS